MNNANPERQIHHIQSMQDKQRILIVEDEMIIAKLMERILVKGNFEIQKIVSNAIDALAAAKNLKPDLILLDIFIEGAMDGIDLAKIVRQYWKIPIIFLTGNSDPATKERAMLTMPAGYLVKPVPPAILLEAVINVVTNERRVLKG